MKQIFGKTADGFNITLDDDDTHVTYHLLETPNLLDLVKEALPTIAVENEDQVVVERDMGRIVGTTNLVETTDADEIVYAKRIGREKYSRFAKNRAPIPTQYIVVVLRKRFDEYILWTAMCGRLLPKEAYIKDSVFSQTHAMAYDESLIQKDTIRNERP